MPIPKIVTQYEYEKFEKPGVDFPASDKLSKSKTIQSDMDAADINKVMARYEKTGVIIDPAGIERKPVYGDFTEIKDYHTQLSAIRNVERAFDQLPAKIRNRFKNDPQTLIDFLEDSNNDREAVELGLKDQSILPLPPVWDKQKSKWTSARDGSVLATQLPPPVAEGTPTA